MGGGISLQQKELRAFSNIVGLDHPQFHVQQLEGRALFQGHQQAGVGIIGDGIVILAGHGGRNHGDDHIYAAIVQLREGGHGIDLHQGKPGGGICFWQDFLGHRLGQGLFQAAQVGDIVADAHPQHRPVLDAVHLRAGHELGFLPAEQGQEQHQQKPAEDQQGLTIGPAFISY